MSYSMIIIDDERIIRDGLAKFIQKTECEFDNGKFGSARKKKVVEVVNMFIKTIIELKND